MRAAGEVATLLTFALLGDIPPRELNGTAWIALNRLSDNPCDEEVERFLEPVYPLSELNGRGATVVLQLRRAFHGIEVADQFESRRIRLTRTAD
jgi:hypothetical protein